MHENTAREEVQVFMNACEDLAEFARHNAGLTNLERRIVRTFVRALEEEVAPFSPERSADPHTIPS